MIAGHSTGGMLAIRYGLMYPADVTALVLVDPIGLEDWKAKGVPWQSVDAWYRQELHTSAERIRDYERIDLLRRHLAAGLREMGADAGRAESRVPAARSSPGTPRCSTT